MSVDYTTDVLKKDIRCKARRKDLGNLLIGVWRQCCGNAFCRAHEPAIHVDTHADHEEGVVWASIKMHACGPVPIFMVLPWVTLLALNALLLFSPVTVIFSYVCLKSFCSRPLIFCRSTLF